MTKKGKGKTPESYKTHNLYVPRDKEKEFEELETLAHGSGVPVNALLLACVSACLPTLKREVPTKRKFKLCGKLVTI